MTSLPVISWTWYGCVSFVVVCRFISRYLHMGSIKALQIDDWLMWLAFATYTIDIVFLNIVAKTPTNLFPPGTVVANFTKQDYAERIYGSKITVLVEQSQILTIWIVKACLLIMYLRITQGRSERKYMKALACYVAFGFVLMEVLYLGVWCRPFTNMWAVPTPNIQCSAATHHLITNAVFNLSSDLLLLAIALPIFLKTMMLPRKKAAICAVFSLGIFNIVAAILNKYYSFTNPFGTQWTNWYCHESSTSMMVANLPFLYTLLRRMFNLSSLNGSDYYKNGYTKQTTGTKKFGSRTDGKATLLTPHRAHRRGYGMGSVMGDEEMGVGKIHPVTVTTDVNIETEKSSIEGAKEEFEMSFLNGGGAIRNKTIITGNEAPTPQRSLSSLSVRDPMPLPREPERAAVAQEPRNAV
ncbi:hypothetical protein K461DRAFT_311096 [Myriangium duriaei CBS 260.36]|uniref:Rhodopsin domain-containing protein n=1 Tax=Myriangium duriaei CBS 260.36 TaxID=1168546 RepID=A0A9P4J4I8_9PEZI|nr:hypothetical protein K461DRAFT_311096 [Myriangium duriaei CBS 260.36]